MKIGWGLACERYIRTNMQRLEASSKFMSPGTEKWSVWVFCGALRTSGLTYWFKSQTVIGGDQDFEIIMSRGVVHDTHQALVRILYKKPAGEEGAGIA